MGTAHYFKFGNKILIFNLNYQFVEGVKPMWEDEANKKGGRWVLKINKEFSDRIWEDLILGFIGEQF